ncbi:MAG: RNA polymerase sigma factor [Paramuribaculum sp.]|nr:RNA polymerase sigma factor [Paramuribaculum sp.]
MNFISLQISDYAAYGADMLTFAHYGRLRKFLTFLSRGLDLPTQNVADERERDFLELTRRYGHIITRICFSYSGNAADMEDLRQDVMINIWNGLKYFKGESSPITWIYRVTLNTCVSMIRKQSRKVKTFSFDSIMTELPDEETDSGYIERLEKLHELMAMLTPVDKAILTMRLDERSYDEIAEVTGLSVSNVATRLNRIKTKLKTKVNQ